MKINYNLTIEDWANFQEYYRKKKSPLYGCMMPALTVLLVCNVVFGFYMVFIYKGEGSYDWLFGICILVLAYLLFMQTRVRRKLLKAGAELKKKKPDVFGTTSMEFFEEGFEIKTPLHTKFLKWEDMENSDQNKDYVFFFSKKGFAYIVPKRNVEDMEKLQIILNS
jgi:hypothetical protein